MLISANYSIQIPEYSGMQIITPSNRGKINGNSSVCLNLQVIVKKPGKHSLLVTIVPDGSELLNSENSDDLPKRSPKTITIIAFGEGAVVHLKPSTPLMDFGVLKVLQEKPKTLLVINEAPIRAQFSAKICQENSVFRVEPTSGFLEAEQATELKITPLLDDIIEFRDILEIDIEHAGRKRVELVATGQGTSIVSEPDMTSGVKFGSVFAKRQIEMEFILKNSGRRHQQLTWATTSIKKSLPDLRSRKSSSQTETTTFKVTPQRMELKPGKEMSIKVTGYCENVSHVSELLVCHVIMGKNTAKELAMKVQVSADFIEPLVELSHKDFVFNEDVNEMDSAAWPIQDLKMKNVGSLPLEICLLTTPPFAVGKDGEIDPITGEVMNTVKVVNLEAGEASDLLVEFQASFTGVRHSR